MRITRVLNQMVKSSSLGFFGFLQGKQTIQRLAKSNDIKFRIDLIVIAALFFVSFIISSDSLVDATLSSRYLGAFCVLLLGFTVSIKRTQNYLTTEIRWLDVFLFVFCAWQVISIVWATNTAEAFSSSFRSVALFMAYLFLRVLLVSDTRWKTHLPLIVSIASSVYLGVLWINLLDIAKELGLNAQSVYTLRYPTETKNLTSIFLLISIPFQVYVSIQNQNWKRWFGIVNAIVMTGTLFFLSTRGISMSIIAIGAVLVLVQLFWKQHRFKFALPLAIGVMALGAGHWFASNSQKASSIQSYKSESELNIDEPQEDSPEHAYRSGNERLGLWKKTLGLIKQDPILGVGAGNWQIEYPRNGLNGLERAEYRVTSFKRPHNEALSILSETGIIGLLLFVLVLLRFFQNGLNGSKSDLLIVFGMVGLIVASMLDFPRERMEHNLLFAVILALTTTGKSVFELGRKKAYVAFFGLLVTAAFGATIYGLRFDGERQYDKLRRLKAQKKYSECIQHAEFVENPFYTVDWINYPIAWFVGVCYSYQGNFEAGEKEFARALKLNPGNFHTHNNLGFCLAQQQKYIEAIPLFESCLRINSKFEEARFNLAYAFIMTEKPERAGQVLNQHITDTAKKAVFLKEIEKIEGSSVE